MTKSRPISLSVNKINLFVCIHMCSASMKIKFSLKDAIFICFKLMKFLLKCFASKVPIKKEWERVPTAEKSMETAFSLDCILPLRLCILSIACLIVGKLFSMVICLLVEIVLFGLLFCENLLLFGLMLLQITKNFWKP